VLLSFVGPDPIVWDGARVLLADRCPDGAESAGHRPPVPAWEHEPVVGPVCSLKAPRCR
jgi:hypothetical protein